MAQPRIAVLSIGTELTSGQIVNSNAAWISARLSEMGVQTSAHLVVPDDRPLIRKALAAASDISDFLFVTGGLGPTTDDFTREMIAEWTQRPLEWHEGSWTHIQNRLRSRGVPLRENQRQQCFYPKDSEVLPNSQGTANAFRLTWNGKTIIVLPGPPKEIEAVWNEHLASWLPSRFPDLDPWITKSWDVRGPESLVAEIAENALGGCPFEKGYRVHSPMVEVKLSYHRSQEKEAAVWIEKLDKALSSLPTTAN
jgi:molybdenum cofactor synthesis domain-containing protein